MRPSKRPLSQSLGEGVASSVFNTSPVDKPRDVEDPPGISLPAPASTSRAKVPPPRADYAPNALLQKSADKDVEEEFSEDEKLLNEFIRLHPMLSNEVTSAKTLQLISNLTSKAHIAVPELPVVGKTYDDDFLAPPVVAIGERECVCGTRCLAKFIARVRFGPNTDEGFVCKEFLTPPQKQAFLEGNGLPAQKQKCLLCTRYFLNYVYLTARTDPAFVFPSTISTQSFENAVLPTHEQVLEGATDLPSCASKVNCTDGYRPEAMLFVDEGFRSCSSQRDSRLSALSFRPVVRFCSSHYKYMRDNDGSNRIVQVGIGFDRNLHGLHFQVIVP
jgi:hypothetical protein